MAKKPTQEELSAMIDKGLGTLLTPADIGKRIKSGELPENFKVDEGFGVYLIEVGGNEYLCVTNILCDKCQRINGKVKKCEAHKRKRRARKSRKEGDVQDDASDREKVGGLRHVDDDDDDEEKIEGAFTPDLIMTPGIGGAIIMVPVDAKNNDRAGPHAKNLNHVKGILVRGAGNIPQFIPNDRLTKAHKLRFDNYIEGELILQNGKEVFVPNNLGAAKMDDKNAAVVAKAAVADKVDQKAVEAIGKDVVVAVQVDVADNGLPVMKVLEGKPKDKETPVGMIVKTNENVQFCQIAGRELGGGKDAKMMACTIPENAKRGDTVAEIYLGADGKAVAVKPGETLKGGTLLGQVVVGQNDQLVFVPKGENKDEWIKKAAAMTPAQKEQLETAQCKVQAAVTGQSEGHIADQMNRIGQSDPAAANAAAQQGQQGQQEQQGAGQRAGEVRSVGFGAQQFGGSCFAKASPGGGGGGAGGAGGGAGGGKQYGSGGEVRSVAMGGGNQFGGSVYAKASAGSGGGSGGGTGGGGYGKGGASGAAVGAGGGGGKQYGSGGEVRSVAMGAVQYGGSGGYGGGGGAKGAGGGGYAGGGGEVQSVAMDGKQFGASVHVFKGSGGGATSPAPKQSAASKPSPAAKGTGNNGSSGAEAKSIGFGNQFGNSVYMKK